MSYLEKRLSSDSGLPTREERFDYTNSGASEYKHPMFGAVGRPKQGNPWSFIDVINPKKHALAFARELDSERGIPVQSSKEAEGSDSGGFSDEVSSQSTIRRLPSGAKPSSTAHTIQAATPVKSNGTASGNPNEQSLSDLVGQSTPLTLGRVAQTEKRSSAGSDAEQRVKDYEGLLKETEWLHQEIAQLKDQLLRSESQQVAKNGKILELNKALEGKTSTISLLSGSLKEKENSMDYLNNELHEVKKQLETSEGNRVADNKKNETELAKIAKNLEEKLQIIVEMKTESQEAPKKNDRAIEELRKTHTKEIDALNQRLKTLDANWHDTLEKEKQKLISDIDGLEAEYDDKTSEFQGVIKEKSIQLAEFQNKLKNSDNALANKIKELETLRGELKQKDENIAEKVKEIESLRNSVKERDDNLTNKFNEIREKDSKLARKNESFKELETKLVRREEELFTKTKQLSSLQEDFERKEEGLLAKSSEIKTLECQLTQKDYEFVKKSKEFDLMLKSKKELATSKESLEEQTQKLESQTKTLDAQIKKLEDRLNKQRVDHDNSKRNFEADRKRFEKLRNKMEEVDRFAKYIENLKLFEKNIGLLIVETFHKNHEITDLEPFFFNTYKDIVGFHTKQHEELSQNLQSKIDNLELKNQELVIQIEHQWKAKAENDRKELKEHKEKVEQLQENFKTSEDKLATTQAKLEIYQEEKAVLLKEKETALQGNICLTQEITKYKATSLKNEQERFLETVHKVESLSETVAKLQGDIKAARVINVESERSLQEKERQINEIQMLQHSQESELKNSQATLQKLQGDPSRKITFEVARRSRPDINAATYDHLMVNEVDLIDMVELQNIVKNLILLLDIPFNRLTKKSPLVAIYLKYERPIFSHFANRLHFQLFSEAIDLKRFSNEAYGQYTEEHDMRAIKHPLQSCLDNLYQKVVSKI